MPRRLTRLLVASFVLALVMELCVHPGRAFGQGRGRGAQAAPPTPRAAAPIDLTGYWVAVISEDWRFRMLAVKGEYGNVPMNDEARKIAGEWDPSTAGSCLAYGAAGLMRMPLRVHITWESETVLKVETDAGQQTRRLLFDKSLPPGPRSLQGTSIAEWEFGPGRGPDRGGSLKVMTTAMSGGWLRPNGVPYSENATMTEYWDQFEGPNGDQWLNVNTFVEDSKYLRLPFATSSHFKKERDGSQFRPSSCKP